MRRLLKVELPALKKLETKDTFVRFVDDDITRWEVLILAPENSVYEHGIFHFTAQFPLEYPFKPPVSRITSPMLHMNICATGCHICTHDGKSIDSNNWKPATNIANFLVSLRNTLKEPFNLERPLNDDLCRLYKYNRSQYGRTVRAHVTKHAVPKIYGDMHGFKKDLIFKVDGVPSLMYQCRKSIRFAMKEISPWDITEDIDELPLPSRMKEFLQ